MTLSVGPTTPNASLRTTVDNIGVVFTVPVDTADWEAHMELLEYELDDATATEEDLIAAVEAMTDLDRENLSIDLLDNF